MPSPLGHAIGGVAAGWAVERLAGLAGRPSVLVPLAFAAAGMLPDIDLAFGAHSGPTHGIGAAAIVGLAVAALTRQPVTGIAVAAAYAAHPLLDWLGTDTTPPIGIMALWPFTRTYYQSDLQLFEAISRRYWLPDFWPHTLAALARELLILVPVVVAAGLVRWRAFDRARVR